MSKFDFLKITSNVLQWCGMGLGMPPGSQRMYFIILEHLQNLLKIFTKSKIHHEKPFFLCKAAFSLKMLVLHRFQKLKASSECSLRTNPSSWKEFRSMLKTYRALFLISRLLFEKMNFLHQQNAEAGQMA